MASRADEYLRRAQQCLEVARTFRDRKARATLSHDKRSAREDQPPMKPSARRIERLLAKVEAELACSARPRRYCFHFDEIAEAEAQGLPYVLAPRTLSQEEWVKKYSPPAPAETKCDRTPSDE